MVTWLACTLGAVVCLPFAFTLGQQAPDAPASSIGWMVYLAIAPMAIGSDLGLRARAHDAGRMGSITYLVPPIAILLGWLLTRRSAARARNRGRRDLPRRRRRRAAAAR